MWFILASLAFLSPAAANQKPDWVLASLKNRGVDKNAAITFQELMVSELTEATKKTVSLSKVECAEKACALKIGKDTKAKFVVFGSLSSLGQKIMVTVTAINPSNGKVRATSRLSVDKIEDLESAANRLARAVVHKKSVDQTAELGNITQQEAKPDIRKEGYRGIQLRLQTFQPLGDSLQQQLGMRFDVGYWFETRNFAIEPSVGFGGNISDDEDGTYGVFKFDIAGHYILGRGNIAPYLGIGAGIRHLSEERMVEFEEGDFVTITSRQLKQDQAWGPAIFARSGLLFLRTYKMHLALNIDYELVFLDLHEAQRVHGVLAGLGAIF